MGIYLDCRYLRYVKPAYDNFVLPTSRYADIVSCFPLLHNSPLDSVALDRSWFEQFCCNRSHLYPC